MVYQGSILYRKALSPMYNELVKVFPRWFTPNYITLCGGTFAFLSCLALFHDYRWASFILFTLYHMFDNMDGKQARRFNMSSEFGACLDHFIDGVFGVAAGAFSLQYACGASQETILEGIFAFTCLFYIVHLTHALTGFFDLGNNYVSIDEAFIFLSVLRLLYAMDIQIPLFQSYTFHMMLLSSVYIAIGAWFIQHFLGKVTIKQIKDNFLLFISFAVYVIYIRSIIGSMHSQWDGFHIVFVFAIPYSLTLWKSKDKH